MSGGERARRIGRLLVANRGEIAARVMRTCRRLGIETVAVFSDADAEAPFVREADVAVRLGPAPSRQSYLDIQRVIEAARLTGADAIHPGYGFLAENAAFAQAVADAGMIFVGPTPEAIRVMGSKIEAKARVSAAGVPIVPGYSGERQDTAWLAEQARALGFPLLLKASAGGGGKGMRIVRSEQGLDEAIDGARREAEGAFGDGALMIERYIERPRHVEVQILGDAHGNLVHLFERECSVQRRHQKIIEESPSTALDDALRQRMGAAAVAVGQTVGYHNAGTVEFILDPEGGFYFLEVNTRLQVEHPVTEMITGLDLVAEQLRVAEGEALGYAQEDLQARGAAVEVRIYAEDPDAGFLPSIGTLADWHLPPMEGLRVDSGVEAGQEIPVHYDPMLAKIITWGDTRAQATRRMVRALRALSVHGVRTNRDFLLRTLTHPAYEAGQLSTHFIDEHLQGPTPPVAPELLERAAVAAALASWTSLRGDGPLPHLEPGFRNNLFADDQDHWLVGERQVRVALGNLGAGRVRVTVDGGQPRQARVVSWEAPDLTFEDHQGVVRRVRVVVDGERFHLHDLDLNLTVERVGRFPEPGADGLDGGCTAPMPGQVIRVEVEAGQRVEAGQALVILEAMKMEHTVRAPEAGVVAQVLVEVGQQVSDGEVLVVMEG